MYCRTKQQAINNTLWAIGVFLGVSERALGGGEVGRGGLHTQRGPSKKLGELRG